MLFASTDFPEARRAFVCALAIQSGAGHVDLDAAGSRWTLMGPLSSSPNTCWGRNQED